MPQADPLVSSWRGFSTKSSQGDFLEVSKSPRAFPGYLGRATLLHDSTRLQNSLSYKTPESFQSSSRVLSAGFQPSTGEMAQHAEESDGLMITQKPKRLKGSHIILVSSEQVQTSYWKSAWRVTDLQTQAGSNSGKRRWNVRRTTSQLAKSWKY